jgi:hypothetical protein
MSEHGLSRRQVGAALLAPLAGTAQETPARGRKKFSEISASLYAWDLLDEGCESIIETLGESAAVNSTYLVALMHWEKRPLTDYYFPHNPRRKTYFPEDSRAYWRPHLEHYRDTRIKPITTGRPELQGKDWLEMLVTATRKAGWKTGAEISHTILDSERARGECSYAAQRDIYGQGLGQLVCVNNPDTHQYVIGLFTDLAKNYDLDYIQTCLIPFLAGRMRATAGRGSILFEGRVAEARAPSGPLLVLQTVLGGCFCPSCESAAKAAGLDLKAVRRALLPLADLLDHPGPAQDHELDLLRGSNTTAVSLLLRHPELFDWLKFRCASMTRMFQDVQGAVRSINPKIDVRLNAFMGSNWELGGIDFRALKPHLGSVRSSDYSEQAGAATRLDAKRRFLLAIREAIGDEMHFLSAIGVRPKATPELIRQGVVISSECGADGLTLGHYDGAPLRNLRAIRQGLEDADVTVSAG